ncbi:MAG: hypothetical protein ACOY94_03010 [Bacillota bacterium]
MLQGVRLLPHRVTLVGALGGLLASAGRDVELPYLAGVTGHAFRLTLDLVISPSAPVELNFHEVFPLWENLGAWFKRVAARPNDESYEAVREEAIQRIRQSLERGRPAIVYDLLQVPEYGLVVGADESRFACLTLANPDEPAWMEIAQWPPAEHAAFTRAEAITLLDLAPGYDRRRAEVASLRFAVDHFWEPPSRDMWLQHGKGAYEFWQATLASPLPLHGPDPGLGYSYNLLLLHRARRDAAAYLAELVARYPEASTLANAAEAYERLVAVLEEAVALLPFPGEGLEEARGQLAGLLAKALRAEQEGIEQIERSLRALR